MIAIKDILIFEATSAYHIRIQILIQPFVRASRYLRVFRIPGMRIPRLNISVRLANVKLLGHSGVVELADFESFRLLRRSHVLLSTNRRLCRIALIYQLGGSIRHRLIGVGVRTGVVFGVIYVLRGRVRWLFLFVSQNNRA